MRLSSIARQKLDKRLAIIATAAAENRTQTLMETAISKEIFRQNSPLEARWNAAGQVQVYLHYDRNGNPPDSAELATLGVSGIVDSPVLGVVQAWMPADKLENAAALSEVTRISVPSYAVARRSPPATARPRTGSKVTEGDQILGAAQFRSSTGYTGQGMVVGVISDGDSDVSTDQKTGDLPANVWDDPNNSSWGSSGAEGTAMMEIVYDLAPGVKQLGFAGPATTADFLTALNDFASDINANVIVDDIGFPGDAMFTYGNFASGVQDFAQAHPNIHLATAAGNDALGFWAGTWNSTPVHVTVNGVTYTQAMNWGTAGSPNTKLMIHDPMATDTIAYIVEWDDPWDENSSTNDPNDYDVVLYDGSTQMPIACNQGINIGPPSGQTSGCNQTNTQPLDTPGPLPVQGSDAPLSGNDAYLEVFFGTGNPQNNPGTNLKILVYAQSAIPVQVTPSSPGSIYDQSAVGVPVGSSMTPGEITAGAVEPYSPYSIETYSSTGPVEFGIPGTGPGTQQAEAIQKPDFVAPDCVTVTGVGGFIVPFCGTSAAAPHIAGLLALLIPAYPNDDPYTLLQDSASQPAGGNGWNGTYGFGLPNMPNLLTSGHYPATQAAITSPASGTSVNTGQAVTFMSGCLGYNLTYNWNFGTSSIPDSSASNPSVTYNTAGNYTVTLICTSPAGHATTTSSITVVPAPSKGGGGLGFFSLAALISLREIQAYRKRRRLIEK